MSLTRREWLKSALAGATAVVLPAMDGPEALAQASGVRPGAPAPSIPATAGSFRFVHLTDIHVQRERNGDQGFARALKAVESLQPRPDFILTGGDLVFDVLAHGPERSRALFELFNKVLADHTSLPAFHTIGNHDVFGWSPRSGVRPDTAGYGKALARDYLRMERTYHRFDHKGWRFFCLDNIQPGGNERYPYEGFIDGPQMEWFEAELKGTDPRMPVLLCEHIPTVTVTHAGHAHLVKDKSWQVPSGFICTDAARRTALYATRNVRLSLSGHIHERDRVEYLGTTYINDGAVSGNWWKGAYRGVEEGFGIIDCRPDGTFEHRYFDYGWQAKD
jgi:3',5'-cyclic AMP phosphodiesterase CpdA